MATRTTSDKTHVVYKNCNAVAQERVWTERVQNERKTAKSW